MNQKSLGRRIAGRLAREGRKLGFFLRGSAEFWRKGGIATTRIHMLDNNAVLAGKRVLVTGGSLGIGFAIARRFAASGAVVVVTGRNAQELENACATIGADRCLALRWDASDTAIADAKLAEAQALLGGPIDILVNNAGLLINEAFPEVTEDGWDKVYAVNSKGLFFITQALARRWLKEPAPDRVRKIINISSTSGFTPGAHPYRMTKWDVVGMTRGLALNLAPHNIVVNGIAPGRTAGRMLGIDGGNIYDPEIVSRRVALPEEIAELALFLAGDTSNYIIGQTIICDGGLTL